MRFLLVDLPAQPDFHLQLREMINMARLLKSRVQIMKLLSILMATPIVLLLDSAHAIAAGDNLSRSEAYRLHPIKELVISSVEADFQATVIDNFIGKFGNRPPEAAFSDEDIAKVMLQLQAIGNAVNQPIRRYLEHEDARIEGLFFSPTSCGEYEYRDFQISSPARKLWLSKQYEEIMRSNRLASFSSLIFFLKDQRKLMMELDRSKLSQLNNLFRSSDAMTIDGTRGFIRIYYASPTISKIIPDSFKLQELATLSLQNEEIRKTNFYSLPSCMDKAVFFTADALKSRDLMPLYKSSEIKNAYQQIDVLYSQVTHLMNPRATGRCDNLRQYLDMGSVSDSQGDWSKVKVGGGQYIKADSDVMFHLSYAYSSGCSGNKNIVAARKTLEAYANSDAPASKTTFPLLCTLMKWSRNGIGGAPNAAMEKKLEVGLQQKTGQVCSQAYTVVDPNDPSRILN